MYFNIKNRIFIHKLFLLFPFLLPLGMPAKIYFITLFCALCHEGAHFLAAVILGESAGRIFASPFGFELALNIKERKNELIIICAGPALSLILSIIFKFCQNTAVAKINFVLFSFNMLPAIPLDGGRLMKIILWERMGAISGTLLLKKISRFCAGALFILSAWFHNIWLFAVCVLITARSSRLCASPFYKKRCSPTPVRLYYFAKDVHISFILKMISPYSYIAIITPKSKKIIFEWDIIENIAQNGFSLYLSELCHFGNQ